MVATKHVVASPKVAVAMVGGGPSDQSQNYPLTNADLLPGWVVGG